MGFITRSVPDQQLAPSSKMDADIRRSAFEDLFGKILRSGSGRHNTRKKGRDLTSPKVPDPMRFGDQFTDIQSADTLRNAFDRPGHWWFSFTEKDLVIRDQIDQKPVLDGPDDWYISSMILYGETGSSGKK